MSTRNRKKELDNPFDDDDLANPNEAFLPFYGDEDAPFAADEGEYMSRILSSCDQQMLAAVELTKCVARQSAKALTATEIFSIYGQAVKVVKENHMMGQMFETDNFA